MLLIMESNIEQPGIDIKQERYQALLKMSSEKF